MKSFIIGETTTFLYAGKLRHGRVEKVTDKVVTIFDSTRQAFRSFSLTKVDALRAS